MTTSPLPVHLALGPPAPSEPSPSPRCPPDAALSAWQAALRADPGFEVLPEPGGVVLRFVAPADVSSVGPGEVAVVDWPRDTWNPGITPGLRAIVTHSALGARSLAQAVGNQVPVLAVPIPEPIHEGPAEPTDELTFTGWSYDSRRTGPAPEGAQRIELRPGGRLITVVGDAQDADRRWADALFAFTESQRDRADLTLFVWLSHADPRTGPAVVADVVDRSLPYRCRVVVGLGEMTAAQYAAMLARTTGLVAGNDEDGGLRPLVDAMAAGVPAIGSPRVFPYLISDETGVPTGSYDEIAISLVADEPTLTRMTSVPDWPTVVTALTWCADAAGDSLRARGVAAADAARSHRNPAAATRALAALIAAT